MGEMVVRKVATYKRTKSFIRWCREIKKLSGGVCERCGGKCALDHLTVHHILESRIYPEFARESCNVLFLCVKCHGEITRAEHEGAAARLWFYSSLPAEIREQHIPFFEHVLGPESSLVAVLRAGNSEYWHGVRVRDFTS
jgi:hypothetical protein